MDLGKILSILRYCSLAFWSIDLVKPEKDQKVLAVVGVPAESFKVNRKAIRKAVADFAHSIVVVSEPFSVAYSMNLLNNAMIVDIGAGTVDFCIMHGTIPSEEDQRTILTAGDYVDQQLFNLMNEKFSSSTFKRKNAEARAPVSSKQTIIALSLKPIPVLQASIIFLMFSSVIPGNGWGFIFGGLTFRILAR